MVFSSLEFIYLFLLPTLVVFLVLRQLEMERAVIWWLVVVSIAFYGWWSPPHLLLIFGSIAINYGIYLLLRKNRSKALFAFGVVVNLGLLAFFKYADFFIENFNVVLGTETPALNLILPLAISFITFQQISFLRDTLNGDLVECDFSRYVLFVTFFPQLIAGPIVRQNETIPQFRLSVMKTRAGLNLTLGFTLFFIGLFKKIVLADGVAPIANAVFSIADQGQAVEGVDAWFGSIAYTFQIYFDFSGYCDMALGLALMFGIRLPINFNSPYQALSIVEFWRRWHITLSRFLRDFLYIPLGGNRKGALGAKGNLMLTMLLGGLWHGAGWNFVIWGGLHGGYLIINHLWTASDSRAWCRELLPTVAYQFFAWSVTMLVVIIAWVFFRAETFDGALTILNAMTFHSFSETAVVTQSLRYPGFESIEMIMLIMFALTLFVTLLPNGLQLTRNYRPVIRSVSEVSRHWMSSPEIQWRPSSAWGVFLVVTGTAGIIQIYRLNGLTEFIYFNF